MLIQLVLSIFQYLLPPPDELFGGTWEVFGTGRTLVGISSNETEFNTVEKTGDEKTHTLTTSEMPSHTHAYSSKGAAIRADASVATEHGWGGGPWYGDGGSLFSSFGTETESRGGNGSHNNLQPYITVYMWKRTA